MKSLICNLGGILDLVDLHLAALTWEASDVGRNWELQHFVKYIDLLSNM